MPTPAGNTRGSTLSPDIAKLVALVHQVAGQPAPGAAPTAPGVNDGSTNGGLSVSDLLAQMKNGQVSAESMLKLLALLMGGGMAPGAGNISSIQNAGQGGPPPRASMAPLTGPIASAFSAGGGAPGQ